MGKQQINPFHLAFKVKDLESTRAFYIDILGCQEGRSTDTWVDFDFFGHQLSAHISAYIPDLDYCGVVAGIKVPIPHFGCILSMEEFETIQKQLEKHDIPFVVAPYIRYEGEPGEQRTMFVLDYSGNPIEFKAFKNMEEVFAS
ncbi:VOC family protein [Algivirga pacifica]|uniref:VOC family protein n=1 Tax=Algivirga pacifica TaxID=1162670 RepID=A0ABP9D5V2_9BACT